MVRAVDCSSKILHSGNKFSSSYKLKKFPDIQKKSSGRRVSWEKEGKGLAPNSHSLGSSKALRSTFVAKWRMLRSAPKVLRRASKYSSFRYEGWECGFLRDSESSLIWRILQSGILTILLRFSLILAYIVDSDQRFGLILLHLNDSVDSNWFWFQNLWFSPWLLRDFGIKRIDS